MNENLEKLTALCPGCGTRLAVPASAQGRKLRCGACKRVFVFRASGGVKDSASGGVKDSASGRGKDSASGRDSWGAAGPPAEGESDDERGYSKPPSAAGPPAEGESDDERGYSKPPSAVLAGLMLVVVLLFAVFRAGMLTAPGKRKKKIVDISPEKKRAAIELGLKRAFHCQSLSVSKDLRSIEAVYDYSRLTDLTAWSPSFMLVKGEEALLFPLRGRRLEFTFAPILSTPFVLDITYKVVGGPEAAVEWKVESLPALGGRNAGFREKLIISADRTATCVSLSCRYRTSSGRAWAGKGLKRLFAGPWTVSAKSLPLVTGEWNRLRFDFNGKSPPGIFLNDENIVLDIPPKRKPVLGRGIRRLSFSVSGASEFLVKDTLLRCRILR